ncbi:MAG: oligosaccharide flippase family protein, partial [bacterium]|nr:oligosaccharide flippase family protein [bacterium]
MSEGLRKTTVRGASWTGLAQAAGYVVTLGSLGLATRYLETSAFGVEAAVLTVIGMGTILADLGTGRALVQRPDLRDAHLVAAFWIGLFSSSILALLVWQTAGFWERLFAVSGMAAVLPVFASGLVFTGLGVAPRAHMERVLRFGHLATIDVVGSFLAGVILVVFSARGMGLWSLAWAYAVRCGVQGMGPWLFCPVVPWNSFGFREVKDLVGFGGKWAGSHLVGFAQQNLDYFLVGRFLGSEALGYYWLAYRLIAFPQTRLMQVVSKVTFPAFSAIQADLPRMRRAYLDTVTYVA